MAVRAVSDVEVDALTNLAEQYNEAGVRVCTNAQYPTSYCGQLPYAVFPRILSLAQTESMTFSC